MTRAENLDLTYINLEILSPKLTSTALREKKRKKICRECGLLSGFWNWMLQRSQKVTHSPRISTQQIIFQNRSELNQSIRIINIDNYSGEQVCARTNTYFFPLWILWVLSKTFYLERILNLFDKLILYWYFCFWPPLSPLLGALFCFFFSCPSPFFFLSLCSRVFKT